MQRLGPLRHSCRGGVGRAEGLLWRHRRKQDWGDLLDHGESWLMSLVVSSRIPEYPLPVAKVLHWVETGRTFSNHLAQLLCLRSILERQTLNCPCLFQFSSALKEKRDVSLQLLRHSLRTVEDHGSLSTNTSLHAATCTKQLHKF